MVALNALNTQRETLKNEDVVRLHGIVTAGGAAANSVPASVRYEGRVRARSDEALRDASGKMDRCLRAGALALGAKVRIVTIPGYLPIRHDRKMTGLFQANAERLVGAGSVIRHPWDRVRGGLDRHGRPQPDHAGHPSLQRRRQGNGPRGRLRRRRLQPGGRTAGQGDGHDRHRPARERRGGSGRSTLEEASRP